MTDSFISPFKYLLSRLIWWFFPIWFGVLGLSYFIADEGFSQKISDFYEVADDIEVLSFGNSFSEAMYFPAFGREGFAFINSREDVPTMRRNFRAVIDYVPNLRYVFVSVGPGYLGYRNSSSFNLSVKNLPAVSVSPRLSLYEVVLIYFEKYLYIPFSDANTFFKELIKALVVNTINKSSAFSGLQCVLADDQGARFIHEFGVMKGYRQNLMTPDCIDELSERAIKQQYHSVKNAVSDNPDVWQENISYLLSVADQVHEIGGQLLLVVTPFTSEYYHSLKIQELVSIQAPYIDQLSSHPAITYLDYHDFFYDSGYQKDNLYFSDPSHLSLSGAKIFSKHLSGSVERLKRQ